MVRLDYWAVMILGSLLGFQETEFCLMFPESHQLLCKEAMWQPQVFFLLGQSVVLVAKPMLDGLMTWLSQHDTTVQWSIRVQLNTPK